MRVCVAALGLVLVACQASSSTSLDAKGGIPLYDAEQVLLRHMAFFDYLLEPMNGARGKWAGLYASDALAEPVIHPDGVLTARLHPHLASLGASVPDAQLKMEPWHNITQSSDAQRVGLILGRVVPQNSWAGPFLRDAMCPVFFGESMLQTAAPTPYNYSAVHPLAAHCVQAPSPGRSAQWRSVSTRWHLAKVRETPVAQYNWAAFLRAAMRDPDRRRDDLARPKQTRRAEPMEVLRRTLIAIGERLPSGNHALCLPRVMPNVRMNRFWLKSQGHSVHILDADFAYQVYVPAQPGEGPPQLCGPDVRTHAPSLEKLWRLTCAASLGVDPVDAAAAVQAPDVGPPPAGAAWAEVKQRCLERDLGRDL